MHRPQRVLVTGGAGFIGANFVHHLVASDPDLRIVVLDALTYAGSRHNLDGLAEDRVRLVHGDILDGPLVDRTLAEESVDTVVHFAAESHVDRSIDGPDAFVMTNVVGTLRLLQAARRAWQGLSDGVRFHHVSTDEVYGSLGADGLFTEDTAYDPSSPYSASKAAADHLVRAWHRTYGLPVTLSNCSNNYGPRHFPEKLVPLMIQKALACQPLPIYGKGENVRDWLHVADHCRAIDIILRRGQIGRTYNVGGHNEVRNLDVVHAICDHLDRRRPRPDGASYRDLVIFVPDRPGHDLRYAIDASRIERELGWKPERTFAAGLAETIDWYLDNQEWCRRVTAERYGGERLGLG